MTTDTHDSSHMTAKSRDSDARSRLQEPGPRNADSNGSSPRSRGPRPKHPQPTLNLERVLADQGYDLVVGFDEVGRGALAGPVMVGAAAIDALTMPTRGVPAGVADSKLLTPRQRESILDELRNWCMAYAVGQATNKEIDEWGISHALGIAALRALKQIEIHLGVGAGTVTGTATGNGTAALAEAAQAAHESSFMAQAGIPRIGAILDGPNDYITKALDTLDAPILPVIAHVTTLVKADQRCASVATASVIAKVTRDHLMIDIDHGNPAYRPYHWAQNKGYGSAEHRAAIARYGATDLHRRSWHLI